MSLPGRMRFLILLFGLLAGGSVQARETVYLVGPEYSPVAHELRQFLQELGSAHWQFIMVSHSAVQAVVADIRDQKGVRVIALGQESIEQAGKVLPDAPRLGVFIRRPDYERLTQQAPFSGPGFSAIFLESPPRRQLNLISILLPRARTVSVLAPVNSPARDWPKHPSLSVQEYRVRNPDELPKVLSRALEQTDALLATPEPEIYNRNLIKLILLSAYRHGKPVIGPSLAYVRAGSLATTFSSIGDFAREIIEALEYHKEHGVWPKANYARYFSVAVNRQVARSLGLNPPSDDVLRHELERMEGAP